MKTYVATALLLGAVCFAGAALAESGDSRVVVLWSCKVKEGKTLDEVKAHNASWVEHMNANVEGGDIRSYVLSPIVGESGGFQFADSFPSLEAWAQGRAAMQSDAGQAVEAGFNELADCSESSLHQSDQS